MAKIGVVTVLYNSEACLTDFFDSLNKQTYKDFVLYAIDNNSSDNSVDTFTRLSKSANFECFLFEERSNLGIAKGNNIGIKRAIEDGCGYVLLSNNDVVFNANVIQILYSRLELTDTSLVIPLMLYYDQKDRIWSAGGWFSMMRSSTPHRGLRKAISDEYLKISRIEYAPTCFMLIDINVFRKVGVMDEQYFVYYDDTDFVWRATKRGKFLMECVPDAKLWHKVGYSTGGGNSIFSIKYNTRNRIYFARKHFSFLNYVIFRIYLFLLYNLVERYRYNKDQRSAFIQAIKDGTNMPIPESETFI